MKIYVYQVIVSAVALAMISQGVKNYVRGKSGQTLLKLGTRIVVWGGMMLIAIFPQATNILAGLIGLQGNINAVILSGFLLIFLMIFKLLSAIERLEQNISELTRKESLKDLDK
jgi:hypothetical protein